MKSVYIPLTRFTADVQQTGSACICKAATCLNEHARQGRVAEWEPDLSEAGNHACQLSRVLQIKPWSELAGETKAA